MITMKSKQPRKQRKERFSAPLHRRQKYLHAALSKELREEMKTRSAQVKVGDTVKMMRGDHAGTEGEVQKADLKSGTIHVAGVSVFRAVQPSNVVITKMELDDEERKKIFSR